MARANRDPNTIGKIVSTEGTCGGDPRVDGTRIMVSTIVECFRGGMSMAEMAAEFRLEEDDVSAALRFQMTHESKLARDEIIQRVQDALSDLSDLDDFGYDIRDSQRLYELRGAIDEHLGWASEDAEERGDYVVRIEEVGAELARLRRQLSEAQLQVELAKQAGSEALDRMGVKVDA